MRAATRTAVVRTSGAIAREHAQSSRGGSRASRASAAQHAGRTHRTEHRPAPTRSAAHSRSRAAARGRPARSDATQRSSTVSGECCCNARRVSHEASSAPESMTVDQHDAAGVERNKTPSRNAHELRAFHMQRRSAHKAPSVAVGPRDAFARHGHGHAPPAKQTLRERHPRHAHRQRLPQERRGRVKLCE